MLGHWRPGEVTGTWRRGRVIFTVSLESEAHEAMAAAEAQGSG